MPDTFDKWHARIEATEDITIATVQAQFGDGYKQIASNGLNAALESWSLTCNGRREDMFELRAFLKSHVISSFWWVNPWGEKKLYRVKSDSIAPKFVNGELAEISFTFEQSFAP